MKEIGKTLLSKADDVLELWIADVRRDIDTDFPVEMTYEAIRNRLPWLVETVATSIESVSIVETQDFKQRAMFRVELGFDFDEMLREFKLLRQAMLRVLAMHEQSLSCNELIRVSAAIDDVFNSIAKLSMEQYSALQIRKIAPSTATLLSSNHELLSLLQAQKDNATHLAHELKNPLNAIISFSAVLMRNQKARASQILCQDQRKQSSKEIEYVGRIRENGQRILQLINDMLEVSRKESAHLALTVEPIDIAEFLGSVMRSLEPLADEKNLNLSLECDNLSLQIYTDRLRLHQIVVNLVSNAIRYTARGSVRVRCFAVSENHWALSVQDTGIGMSMLTQARIFEPYFREKLEQEDLTPKKSEPSLSPQNNGLGLAIVKKLVQLLQGKIELVSELQEGTTFTVVFPADLPLDRHRLQ